MEESYDHKKIEDKIADFWAKGDLFTPQIDLSKKPFSMYLVPPNASGPMHVGNALMIAIQDILARHFRAKGTPTLWIPMTDQGGYETEITFERELEKIGKSKTEYRHAELFEKISAFVDQNNILIKDQIRNLGASVDWTRFRYNMNPDCVEEIGRIFRKMINEDLISRRPCMINYCPTCATTLSDIELKQKQEQSPLYFVKFYFEDADGDYISLATTRPEFLFSITHVLVHPSDKRRAHLIGKKLKNPIHGDVVEVIASKRKFDPKDESKALSPFAQSYVKFDYEYALMSNIPITAQNLIDWEGNMTERYQGMKPVDARKLEIDHLQKENLIEKIDPTFLDSALFCKKGHHIEEVIMMTWSLDLDKEGVSLKKTALEAVEKESLSVFPHWRKQDLIKWLKIMKYWPIARQNVWGIRIPAWYDISDPSKFFVWFIDSKAISHNGNLKSFLDQGFSLQEISDGLNRIYTSDPNAWTLNKEPDKNYLPETDTFDTWFSGQWATMIFGEQRSQDFSYFYPSDCLVIGHDLVRLSVARKIMLNLYLTDMLPYRSVYFHGLLKGPDGQKMSKSLGNVVTLEHYLENFGADVTRMSMVSYTGSQEDFILSEQTLLYFQEFTQRLWRMGRIAEVANQHASDFAKIQNLDNESDALISSVKNLSPILDKQIEQFAFSAAQAQAVDFISNLEEYVGFLQSNNKKEEHLAVFRYVFEKYLILLHPFVPFITEELYRNLSGGEKSLSSVRLSY